MSDPKPTPPASQQGEVATAASPSDVFARPVKKRVNTERIPKQFGRYRIEECLGKGGMGAVFRAHDTGLDRLVALKVPFLGDDGEETRQRFYREARAAATLQHANICSVFDVGEFQGIPYLTMAFIEGRPLSAVANSEQNLSYTQVALLVRKLALAMQEAHSRGVIHRDLKPANVLLRPNGEPVIMDFGLARRADDKQNTGLTQEGDILGTLDYMAPEQAEGNHQAVGPAADIYALGVILYELLCGKRPFKGNTAAMLVQILQKEPTAPSEIRPGIPPRLEQICLKAMAKKPADRFPTMAHFANALADYLRSVQSGAAAAAKSANGVVPPRPAPPAQETERVGPAADTKPSPAKAPPPPEREEQARASGPKSAPKSGPRSGSKSRRSGKRRKSKQTSLVPFLVGGGLALAVVVIAIVAVIAFWPRSDKPSAVAVSTGPSNPRAAPYAQSSGGANPAGRSGAGPGAGQPRNPGGGNQANLTPSKTQPKAGPGFVVTAMPERVALDVGVPQKVELKIERKDYQGPVNVSWTVPPGVRVSPTGPVTVKPGQPDPTLTVQVLSEEAVANFTIDVNAAYADDAKRAPVTASVEVVAKVGGPCIRVIEPNLKKNFAVEAVGFAPDMTVALVAGGTGQPGSGPGSDANAALEGNAIQVVNIERGEVIGTLSGHRDRVHGIAISGDGKTVLSWSGDETIALWDLIAGKRKNQSPKQGMKILNAAISPDAKRGLVIYAGFVAKVNLDTFTAIPPPLTLARLVGSTAPPDALRAAAISTELKALVGGLEGKLFMLDLAEKGRAGAPKPLAGHEEAVLAAAFAPSGKVVATGGGGVVRAGSLQHGRDNVVCLWNVAEQTMLWKGEGHNHSVTRLAFSSDGSLLASGAADGTIKIWSVADGRHLQTFTGHTGPIEGLAFSPDGRTFWSGSADRTLRHWRLP